MSVAAGAELLVGESEFPEAKEGTTVVGPQVLVNVDHCECGDRCPRLCEFTRVLQR